MATITQDMRYRLSLIKYADKYGLVLDRRFRNPIFVSVFNK